MKRVVTGDGEEGSCGGGGAVSEKCLTYKGIISKLTTMFKETSAPYGTVQLVGLIFGRPELQLVQEQLMPNLSYWHHRSAKNIDFFCI
ncbi:hypothetical protein [Solidesulfovibrio fructosivorans]|uniref:hypothetical protein n=1 Tax=Solidesulfovibrio fructosivorans TaxID=878 RepID=UPI00117F85F4|nr:hypothetical protein [Solidesulfovibrio fructosivorans]